MSEKNVKILRIALIIVSIVMIVTGCLRGEHFAVLNKAIKVCMQCIGIG
jgi:hypothetical protein